MFRTVILIGDLAAGGMPGKAPLQAGHCVIIAMAMILLSFVCLPSTCFAADTTSGAASSSDKPDVLLKAANVDAKFAPAGLSGWFLKPVVRLQDEVIRLEQQIGRLKVSLDALPAGTQALTNHMFGIQGQTADLLTKIVGSEAEIQSLQTDLNILGRQIADLKDPIKQVRDPLTKIYNPLVSIDNHVISLGSRFTELDGRFTKLDSRFKTLDSRFKELDNRFKELDSRFTELDNRFKELDSRFTELDTRFAALDGRFVTLGKQLGSLQSVLGWVIAAVLGAATIIVAGIIVVFVLSPRRNSKNSLYKREHIANFVRVPRTGD